MNHQRHYDAIMSRAKGRVLDGYTEKHRILPGCMGGTYAAENVVRLTAEEHYLAHLLLVKIHPANGLLAWAAIQKQGVRLAEARVRKGDESPGPSANIQPRNASQDVGRPARA